MSANNITTSNLFTPLQDKSHCVDLRGECDDELSLVVQNSSEAMLNSFEAATTESDLRAVVSQYLYTECQWFVLLEDWLAS